MSVAKLVERSSNGETRPVGAVQPTHERAAAALRAIAGLRHADAEHHAVALPDAPFVVRSWKLLTRGLLSIERGALREAEPLFLQAAALAFVDAGGDDGGRVGDATNVSATDIRAAKGVGSSSASRVAAEALHHLGWVYRRQERAEQALRVHHASLRLRDRFASFEQLWETTCKLGLDADVARSFDDAERHHREAIDLAKRCTDEPARREALAWTNLATSLSAAQRHEHAVAAERSARDAWRRHDVAATAAEADLNLGSMLLMHGRSLSESADVSAVTMLDEATKFLAAAEQGLSAFGSDYATQTAWCREQLDFANRLAAGADPT